MSRSWNHCRWSLGAVLCVGLLLVGSGCGKKSSSSGSGGDSDSDKIVARVHSLYDHLNRSDTKGVISDFPPATRSSCNEAQVQQVVGLFKSLNVKLKDVKVDPVSGSQATAAVTSTTSLAGKASDST